MTIHYFAYGSNMSQARMLARVPEADDLGRGYLEDWAFACNKSGMDGSAKANLMPHPGERVWGVVYRLPASRLPELDAIEGGYRRLTVTVCIGERDLSCHVYASDRLTDDPIPFDWYQVVMVTGAEEHSLPEETIEGLRRLPSR
ncbi:MAG: gamma-glutamylcyclotransferase [Deltaproteobacteria bacterium]|nr:gamma-glutamylcyclotransferase [Deltaproteobacteria bacterium]